MELERIQPKRATPWLFKLLAAFLEGHGAHRSGPVRDGDLRCVQAGFFTLPYIRGIPHA